MAPDRSKKMVTPDCEPNESFGMDEPMPGNLDRSDFHTDFRSEDLADAKLQSLHAIWQSKCRADKLPSRADFDPTQLPPELLPWITIIDVEGERFRMRLIGTGIVDALGVDQTGVYFDDLPDTHDLEARARWIVRHAKPLCMTELPVTWLHDHYKRYAVLGVPLATNGVDVDKLLYVLSFEQ